MFIFTYNSLEYMVSYKFNHRTQHTHILVWYCPEQMQSCLTVKLLSLISIADPKLTQILMVWTCGLLSASTRLCLIETV